jgi:Ulp1 family protease
MTVGGKYIYKTVSRWSRKLPGRNIFNLRKIFIPIKEKNQHCTCIVIFMKEKQIQYYDSLSIGADKKYMDSILQYLVDEDKGQGRVKKEEWTLVPSNDSVPKQENKSDCGAFICIFGYFISQDTSLEFTQENVTSFRERMALAIINCANNTKVQADSDDD